MVRKNSTIRSQPSFARGSLLKVEGVLLLAKGNRTLRSQLDTDYQGFLKAQGIFLTSEEKKALKDVLKGTATSVFAIPPPKSPFDKMKALRELWGK